MVSRSTWFVHNPTGERAGRRPIPPAERNPSPGVVSRHSMDLDVVDILDVSDQEDDGNRAARSDEVRVLHYLICPVSLILVFRTG